MVVDMSSKNVTMDASLDSRRARLVVLPDDDGTWATLLSNNNDDLTLKCIVVNWQDTDEDQDSLLFNVKPALLLPSFSHSDEIMVVALRCNNDLAPAIIQEYAHEDDAEDTSVSTDPILLVNPAFEQCFKNYKFSSGDFVILNRVRQAVPLQRVVLLSKERSQDHTSQQQLDSFKEQLVQFAGGIICRDSIIRLHGHNGDDHVETYYVADSQPVVRGLLTAETVVVLLHDEATISHIEQEGAGNNRSQHKLALTARTTSALLSSSFIQVQPPHASKALVTANTTSTSPEFNLVILNDHRKAFFERLAEHFEVDHHSIAIVSLRTLRDLSLFNRSWVKIVDKKNKRQRYVCLCSVENTSFSKDLEFYQISDNTLYVSLLLHFNFTKQDNNAIASLEAQLQTTRVSIETEADADKQEPEVADDVVVSVVQNPNSYGQEIGDAGTAQFKKQLKQYFKTPRLLRAGDIFAVPFVHVDDEDEDEESDGESDQQHQNDSENKENHSDPLINLDNTHDYIYYRINKVTKNSSNESADSGLLVQYGISNLIGQGAANAYLPPLFEPWLHEEKAKELATVQVLKTYQKLTRFFASLLSFPSEMMMRNTMPFSLLLDGPKGCGKQLCIKSLAHTYGFHVLEINCYEAVGPTDAQTEDNLKAVFKIASDCSPCILYLRQFEALAQDEPSVPSHMKASKIKLVHTFQQLLHKRSIPKKANKGSSASSFPLVLIATTEKLDRISVPFRAIFAEKVHIEPPDLQERKQILTSMVGSGIIPKSRDISISHLAQQLGGAQLRDIFNLVENASAEALKRIMRAKEKSGGILGEDDICAAGAIILEQDFEAALKCYRDAASENIGAPKVPNVTWSDIGGLTHAKNEVLDTIQLPIQHPELFASGLKQRSGVLLFGPPGTGKTLLAKAVATECSLNFLSVKGPELINMYIGESERNIREIFQKAREARPCVIFFDELDSLAPNRGVNGDSGGVMDRVVSQLLAELDGLQDSTGLFVIGATNRPDLIDPALLRPGRFDRLVYLGVPETKEDQLKVVQALTRKFHLAPDVNLEEVVAMCPMTFTGADFYAVSADAQLNAILRKAEQLERNLAALNQATTTTGPAQAMTMTGYLDTLTEQDLVVEVNMDDFIQAVKNNPTGSVSEADMRRYKNIQQKFK